MPRPPRSTHYATQRALEVLQRSSDLDEVRAAQSVLLPEMGLTLEQTAQVVGRDRYWVSRARNRFIKGDAPLGKHGGRRNAYFAEEQERALVGDILAHWQILTPGQAWGTSIRKMLKERLDAEVGHAVADSTVSDMLDRYASRIMDGAKWAELELAGAQVQGLVAKLAAHERLLPQHREKHKAWLVHWEEQKRKSSIIAS